MEKILNDLVSFANSTQMEMAVIFGMMFQFFLAPRKTWRIALTIVMSSFFIALYVIPVIIDAFGFAHDGNIAKLLYAISALMSMELLAIIIVVLPTGVSLKLKSVLGIKEE